jgi:hypothetical protein
MKLGGRVTPEHAARRLRRQARAEAILLATPGNWDAVPLLLLEPALVILVGSRVVAVVDDIEATVVVVRGVRGTRPACAITCRDPPARSSS